MAFLVRFAREKDRGHSLEPSIVIKFPSLPSKEEYVEKFQETFKNKPDWGGRGGDAFSFFHWVGNVLLLFLIHPNKTKGWSMPFFFRMMHLKN